tara:strand:+ start:340 stop:525 length:186 start_codon:yes stop_codon:yes gene_type:complete
VFKSTIIDNTQNNKNNRSVDIKKEERLADGITIKLNAHNHALALSKDRDWQSKYIENKINK